LDKFSNIKPYTNNISHYKILKKEKKYLPDKNFNQLNLIFTLPSLVSLLINKKKKVREIV